MYGGALHRKPAVRGAATEELAEFDQLIYGNKSIRQNG